MSQSSTSNRCQGAGAPAEAPGLRHIQAWLLDVVTHPRGVEAGLQIAARHLDLSPSSHASNVKGSDAHGSVTLAKPATHAQRLVQTGELTPEQRLEVYRSGYVARLVECLQDDYPAVEIALGADAFVELCRDFITTHPPRANTLNTYGAPFAGYCKARAESWSGFICDLARLQWALVEAIHAPTDEPLTQQGLGSLSATDWEQASLRPSRALTLLHFDYPVNEYLQAVYDNPHPVMPAPAPSSTAVCRSGYDVYRLGLGAPRARLLDSLIRGVPLAVALDQFARSEELAHLPRSELQQSVSAAFSDFIECGFFTAVVT